MIAGKKIIGVCMTKIHDTPRSRTIEYLHKEVEKLGMKLMVFDSPFDFSKDDEIGANRIYDYINYDIVDVLLILCSGFVNKNVYRSIIEDAKAHNTPVVLEDDYDEYCYTVCNAFENALERLMNHVINDHGIRNTFFVAGIKGNEYSENRLAVYKKVLAQNGMPFDESMVDYGDFWAGPTDDVMDRLFARDKALPGAIFCANDAMGIRVCQRLEEKGIRVPQDIIVTGFDGSKLAEFAKPKLSSCIADRKGFVKQCVAVLSDILEGRDTDKVRYNDYTLRLSESCGCGKKDSIDYRLMAEENYRMMVDVVGHEHVLFNEIVTRINTGEMDINSFYGTISKILNNNACFAIRPSFLLSITGQIHIDDVDDTDDRLMVVAANGNKSIKNKSNTIAAGGDGRVIFKMSDMMPAKDMWIYSSMLCVINEVRVGELSCGYLICWTDSIVKEAHIINRVLNMIDMLIHIAVSDMRARFLKVNRNKNTLINAITELPNLRSLTKWFEEYTADSNNKDKAFVLSVYELPNYNYLLDDYGIEELETTLCFIAEALKLSNTEASYIAHTGDDQFIVINYFDNEAAIGDEIVNSIGIFYNLLDKYNEVSDKKYNLKVFSGATTAGSAKEAKLDAMMRKAAARMLENMRIRQKKSMVKSSFTTTKQQYKRFSALIEENLFKYHFQPIVSAENGEIYGYEALMRTDDRIGFNPIEVLTIAREYDRLYDIEKATMFNVLSRYDLDKDKFEGKKVFINCIPGHFLNDDDNKIFGEHYSEYVNNCVFEITEQDSITDNELGAIRCIGNDAGSNVIAVDDYGTGHSNIINLIKYKPEIVKIDRFLMTDIHKDASKQMVVKGVIDFARLNNIKVLAEGIETEEELRKVVEMGVDYIQGYYTGRPAYEPIREIDSRVKSILLEAAGAMESI